MLQRSVCLYRQQEKEEGEGARELRTRTVQQVASTLLCANYISKGTRHRVAKQCIFLAGPGVLLNAFAVAAFLMWYLDWEFLLSLTTGRLSDY
eukprot:3945896-Amphidinium_carterae.2